MEYVSQQNLQKKFFVSLLMLCTVLFSLQYANAQTITIGLGTSSSALYGPVGSTGTSTGARAGRYASIYPASLLTGLNNGDIINSVEYNRATATNTYAPGTSLKIYIKNFPNADWGAGTLDFATAITGATLVYDGDPATIIGNSIGWKQFAFSSPYVFNTANGTNLAVIYDYIQPVGTGPTTTINWYYDNATQYPVYTTNGTKYSASTTNPPVSPVGMATSTVIHPQIKINYTPPPACTTPPNAGSIQAAKQWYCANETIIMNLQGNSFGVGQTYQWQESLNDTNWTSIGAATNTSYSTTQSVATKYYRVIATCSGISDTTNALKINTQGALSGNYTINKNLPKSFTNFTSFNDAATVLNCMGVAGATTFRVSADIYNEQVVIDSVKGSSETNIVRFVGNNSTIKFSSATSANRYVIRFDKSDYVHLDSLTIDADEVESYSYAIHYLSGSSFNKVTNCTIKSSLTSTSTNYSGIVFSGSTTSATTAGTGFNSNIIENNTIIGGYYSVIIYGTSANSATSKGNIIRNNTIQDAYMYSIYTLGCDSTQIKGNDLFRQTRTNGSTFYGVYASTSSLRSTIEQNKIHDPFGSSTGTAAVYGIYVNATDSKKDAFNVKNNIIYNMQGTTGAKYGLYNQGSDSTNFFNNTVIMDDQVASTAVVNAFIHGSTAATGVQLINNIFYINSPGTGNRIAEYWTNNATTFISDNNGYYISNAGTGTNAIAYYNSINYNTLSDWQVYGSDANSIFTDPLFVSGISGNHVPSAASYNNTGATLPQVTEDFTGAVRGFVPDIGAYEFSPNTEDVSMTSIDLNTLCEGLQPIKINLTNAGLNQLNSLQIDWTINGILQTPHFYTGPLAPGASDNITIGQFTAIKDTAYTIVAWSSNPNGSVDLNKSNDTAKTETLKSALSGIYTIGGSGASFPSLIDAALELNNRGTCGNVTLNLNPTFGPYFGQVAIKNVPKTNATDTILINGNGSVIIASPMLTNSRSVILIEGTDYVILDSLNIVVADTATYGWGIHLFAGSDYTTIRNSTITTNKTATSSNFAGIVQSGSLTAATTDGLGTNNLFENNTINGGYYGIAVNGITNNVGALYNRVINNKVNDFYFYGIYINSSDSALVSRNNITRPTRTNSGTAAGVYVTGNSMSVVVERNRIHGFFTADPTLTATSYGIYQTANDPVISRPLIVRNNAIYNMQSNGLIYGIYNNGSNNSLYYNNTVHIEDLNSNTSDAAYAFYQTTTATGIELKNNILYVNKAGTGPRAAVRFNTATNTIASNFNALFVTNIGTGVNAIGYYGTTACDTLSEWQTVSSNDQNSKHAAPLLVSPSSGDVTPNASPLNGTATILSQVYDDLNGALRSVTPDIGALEFDVTLEDAGITAIDSPNAFCAGQQSVKVRLKNFGAVSITNVKINWEINGAVQPMFNFTGSLASAKDTSVTIGTFNFVANTNYNIKSWTTLPNGVVDNININDTVQSSLSTAMFGGYTIGGGSANFPTINAAVQALNTRGVCGTVTFEVDSASGPYNEQVLISNISTSNSQQIIFNGNGAIINFEPTVSANRYIFRLDDQDYVTINGFNINSINGTYAWGVHVLSGSDNNMISNNKIVVNQTSTSSNFSGIVFSGSATSATTAGAYLNNKIIGNTIDGGYYGILIYGTSGNIPATKGHIIKNNTVLNTYIQAIYAIYQQNVEISDNTVSRPTRTTTSTLYGIEGSSVTAGLKITGNKIHNLFDGMQSSTSAAYPIYTSASDHVGGKGLVANNVIYNINGGGIVYGIYNSSSDSIIYAHNSISLEDKIEGKTSATYGFYQTSVATGLDYYNNSVLIDRVTTGNQVAMYFSTNTTIPVCNYNNYFTPNGNVAYHSSLRETMSDWRGVNASFDVNSTTLNPQYNGVNNLIPQPTSPLVNSGTPLLYVNKDIDGTNRSATTPYKGAYEKTIDVRGPFYNINPISNTLSTSNRTVNGVVDIIDFSGVDLTANNQPRIYYKLTSHNNKFIDNTSATNGWKYTTALNTTSPFNFTIDYSKLFNGVVNVNDEIEYFFVAQDLLGYVSSSHGAFKTQPTSIFAIDSNQFGLIGNTLKYRISTAITADTLYVGSAHTLKSLTTNDGLFKFLNENFLAKDLTVIVTSSLSENGANALNEINEIGAGNYNVRIIPQSNVVYNIQGSYTGGLIRLNGADRITIDGSYNGTGRYFDIKNTSTATNTAAIQLIGLGADTSGASYNTIKSSVISTSTTSGNGIGIHIGGLGIPYDATPGNNNNKIIDNKIYKGSVGIYNSGVTGGLSDSLIISGNIIGSDDGALAADNLRLYGMALEYGKNTIIENNIVQNIRNTGAQQSWGIAIYSNFDNSIISKNKIRNVVGGTTDMGGRGIEINAGTSGNIKIANNFISGISGSGSSNLNSRSNVGLYINGTSGMQVYYNSIHLSGDVSRSTSNPDTSVAFYVRGNSHHLDVLNNTFSNTQKNTSDTAVSYAIISKVADTAYINLDYNNYYVNELGAGSQGKLAKFRGVELSNLAAIKSFNTANNSSISLSPNFQNNVNLIPQGVALYQKGLPIAGVIDDIDGDLRNAVTPCIGADEFLPSANEIQVINFIRPNSGVLCGLTSDSIVIIVQNLGTLTQTSINVGAHITGAINTTINNVKAINLMPGARDTITVGYFNSASASGQINIKAFANVAGDNEPLNDTIRINTTTYQIPADPIVSVVSDACIGGTAKVFANTTANINWYSSLTSTTPISKNDTLTTGPITVPTTFYAEATTSTAEKYSVGPVNTAIGSGGAVSLFTYQVLFTVNSEVKIDSIAVFPSASGTVGIRIRDGLNTTTLHTLTFNVTASSGTKVYLPLNLSLPPGDYRIDANAGTTMSLFRNTTGSAYPYSDPNNSIVLTGHTFSGYPQYHYYFYDWKVQVGNQGCGSARVPITVTPNPLPSGSGVAQASPFQGEFNAGTLANADEVCVGDTLTYSLIPPTGFNAQDLGVTWSVVNPIVKTLKGAVPAGVINMSGLSLQYIASAGDKDSTLVFTANVKNLQTGCDTFISRYLNVNGLPVVNLGADKTICLGDTTTLDAANTGATYLWSNGDTTQTIRVATSGVYVVRVTNASGCYTEDTINVNVTNPPVANLGADIVVCENTPVVLDAGNVGSTYLWSTGATTQTINVTQSNTYSVIITTGICVDMDTIQVTINPLPVVNLGANQDICTSDTITLDAGNPGANYLWSTGATTRTIRVSNAATYSVMVTNPTTGCIGRDTLVVTNKATPVSTFNISTASGLSVTFLPTVTSGLQYSWNFGDPSSPSNTSQLTSPTHVFTSQGIYNVTLTATNVSTGCKSTTVLQIDVTIGIQGVSSEIFKLKSAPNPFVAETQLSYVLPENANSVTLEVYDVLGRKVSTLVDGESQEFGEHKYQFTNNNTELSSGVYIVRLTVDGKVANTRIIDAAKR